MASGSSESKKKKIASFKSQSREFIYRLREYFEKERDNGGPLLPVTKVVDRVCDALKVGKTTVKSVTKEKCPLDFNTPSEVLRTPGKQRPRPSSKTSLDTFQKDAIRQHIHQYYMRKEFPTREKLLVSLKEASLFDGGKTSLSIVLKQLGFRYKKFSGRRAVMERSEIVAWRGRFLREILNISPEKVVWLDETWVNAGHTKSLAWTDDTVAGTFKATIGKGSRLILLHAGSVHGFVPGAMLLFRSKSTRDYHEEMNGKTFTNWFKSTLLPNISANSVIVMDNAPYHSVQLNKAPTMKDRKDIILKWLVENDVPGVSADMTKAELIQSVKFYKPRFCTYEIDSIATAHGHIVIRLPPYHCHFNSIELIWAQVKDYVAENNTTFRLTDVEHLVQQGIQHVSVDKWKSVVAHTWKVLQQAKEADGIVETRVEQLIISLDNDSSDTSDSSDEAAEIDIYEECGVFPLEY